VSGTPNLDLPLEDRFRFGRNWRDFLASLTPERIRAAEESLTTHLGPLKGKRFLDVGSGSGLFSLAARNLGAEVTSFDYDPDSVACANFLRERFHPQDGGWRVFQGSALDAPMLAGLDVFDVVYSWGVLHHTGDMWTALGNVLPLVRGGGRLFISIYNDQGGKSLRWRAFKRLFIRSPRVLQLLAAAVHILYWEARLFLIRLVRGRNPFVNPLAGGRERGMNLWHDTLDWLGGYPFEVAKPEAIFDFCSARGFVLERLATCGGGHGCNEYVFVKGAAQADPTPRRGQA